MQIGKLSRGMIGITLFVGLASAIAMASIQAAGLEPIASFPPGTRVLFQGDSITDMNRGRNADPNHILGHSYAFIIASKAGSTYPERKVEYINRGVSGNTVTDLAARWQVDAIDLKPDILSILIGVNDLGFGVSAEDYKANFSKLLDRTVAAMPNVKLVLCEPFGLPTGPKKAGWDRYQNDLAQRQAVVSELATKYHATFVRLQSVFDEACRRAPAETWMWDGVHPTYAGQQLIADAWVRSVNASFGDPLISPSRNSAIAPQVNFERDSYDWLHRHADVLDSQKRLDPEVVMIGDSITHFWGGEPKAGQRNGPKAWDATFHGVRVLNMGFGWDRTQNVLWRLQHGEFEGIHPNSIVLNIGTNNLVGDETARTNTPDEVAEGIKQIVGLLRERSPQSHIYVMGVFPRGFEKGNELDLRITALNKILRVQLAESTQVTLLDIGKELRESDGSVSPQRFSDGTHPTEKGYEIWGQALRNAGIVP